MHSELYFVLEDETLGRLEGSTKRPFVDSLPPANSWRQYRARGSAHSEDSCGVLSLQPELDASCCAFVWINRKQTNRKEPAAAVSVCTFPSALSILKGFDLPAWSGGVILCPWDKWGSRGIVSKSVNGAGILGFSMASALTSWSLRRAESFSQPSLSSSLFLY